MSFIAEPSESLKNGDSIDVEVTFSDDYDLDSLVAEYHIMPTRLQNTYTVTGLYLNPNGIEEFSEETRENLMREGREAARVLLEEEYEDEDRYRHIRRRSDNDGFKDQIRCYLHGPENARNERN